MNKTDLSSAYIHTRRDFMPCVPVSTGTSQICTRDSFSKNSRSTGATAESVSQLEVQGHPTLTCTPPSSWYAVLGPEEQPWRLGWPCAPSQILVFCRA